MTVTNRQYRKIQGVLGDQSFSVVLPKQLRTKSWNFREYDLSFESGIDAKKK